MRILPFQAIIPNLNLIASPESFFGSVKARYPEYQTSGFFKKTASESIFIYEIRQPAGHYKGFISCTDIRDFMDGFVLKHEHTLAPKEQQMMQLTLQNRAMVKPVLLAYDAVADINTYLDEVIKSQEPFFRIKFKDAQEEHIIWQISDGNKINELTQLFKSSVSQCYIADGHHRVSTAIQLHANHDPDIATSEPFDKVLSIYLSFDELKIYDYNRTIKAFHHYAPIKFMAELSRLFKIKPLKKRRKPKRKFELTMCIENEWFSLKWKKKVLERYESKNILFDADILNTEVLEKILGIHNIREDQRIAYIGGKAGSRAVDQAVDKDPEKVGFCLFPISASELKQTAESGRTLPPKSTWFEPRIKNGLIVKEI